jgi:mono/diheme cytochrome c family protein
VNKTLFLTGPIAAGVLGLAGAALAQSLAAPSYTAAQAARGEAAYKANCLSCHGDQLDNGQFGAPLRGPAFTGHWGAGGLDGPWEVMSTMMPPDNPGSLPPATYAELMAFVLSKNGVPAGDKELPADGEQLKAMAAPR